MIIDYSTVRARLRWFAWPTLISAVLFAHFMVAAGLWLVWLAGILRNLHMRGAFLPSLRAAAPVQRYQISVDIATKEYWDRGGRAHEYVTWWWYNDRWFR